MGFKLSNYNYYASNARNDFLIYNTRTGAIISGDKEQFDVDAFFENIENFVDHQHFSHLLEEGIVVESGFNEILAIKEAAHDYDDESNLKLTIVPTLDCNFECSYCFAKSNNSVQMSEKIRQKIVNFAKSKIEQSNDRFCQINWLGGEPLLVLNKILSIMDDVHNLNFGDNERLEIRSGIVTNGYLLSHETFEKLINSGVSEFQITFDGEKSSHDKYRYLKHGKTGSFDVIHKNLIDIKENFQNSDYRVTLRVNFSKETYLEIENITKMLKRDFGDDSRFSFAFKPILDFGNGCKQIFFTKKEARNIELEIAKHFCNPHDVNGYKEELHSLLPMPIRRWCMAYESHSLVVDYEGNIYSCDSYIANPSESIGKLDESGKIIYTRNFEKWKENDICFRNPRCIDCKRLPICLGGCKRERFEGKYECHWTDDGINTLLLSLLSIT